MGFVLSDMYSYPQDVLGNSPKHRNSGCYTRAIARAHNFELHVKDDTSISPVCSLPPINLQATKLLFATSATKGGGGYHPLRFSVWFKIL